jgi:hypothetical protein
MPHPNQSLTINICQMPWNLTFVTHRSIPMLPPRSRGKLTLYHIRYRSSYHYGFATMVPQITTNYHSLPRLSIVATSWFIVVVSSWQIHNDTITINLDAATMINRGKPAIRGNLRLCHDDRTRHT